MIELQNPDGGFPCRGRKGNPSCLNDTCSWIGKLIKDPTKEAKESLRKACERVLSTQSEEGVFVESEELASVPDLPLWVRPRKPTPDMPQLIAYLLQSGYSNREETKKAIAHLLGYWQNPNGSFKKKYLIWAIIEILRRTGLPEDSKEVQEAIKATRTYLQEECWNSPPDLLWCLSSLRSAEVSKDHPLVKEVFQRLTTLRNKDGGWSNEDIKGKIQSQTDPSSPKLSWTLSEPMN